LSHKQDSPFAQLPLSPPFHPQSLMSFLLAASWVFLVSAGAAT